MGSRGEGRVEVGGVAAGGASEGEGRGVRDQNGTMI